MGVKARLDVVYSWIFREAAGRIAASPAQERQAR
jgi:hypothetical protein